MHLRLSFAAVGCGRSHSGRLDRPFHLHECEADRRMGLPGLFRLRDMRVPIRRELEGGLHSLRAVHL